MSDFMHFDFASEVECERAVMQAAIAFRPNFTVRDFKFFGLNDGRSWWQVFGTRPVQSKGAGLFDEFEEQEPDWFFVQLPGRYAVAAELERHEVLEAQREARIRFELSEKDRNVAEYLESLKAQDLKDRAEMPEWSKA